MISKKDSKTFLIKQAIGGKQTNKDDTIYESDWQVVYGLISEPSGSIYARIYGSEEVYDKVIVVNATANTRSFQNNTLIMLDDMPTVNYEYGDYDIARIYPEYNGEIRIGLNKRQAIDLPKLYFDADNNGILYYQLNYDRTTKKAYIKTRQPLPFSIGDYVWTRQPVDNTVTKHLMTFTSQTKIGFDDHYQPFYELTFEDVVVNNEQD